MIHMIIKQVLILLFVLIGFVTQNDKIVESERVKTSLVSVRRLVYH